MKLARCKAQTYHLQIWRNRRGKNDLTNLIDIALFPFFIETEEIIANHSQRIFTIQSKHFWGFLTLKI